MKNYIFLFMACFGLLSCEEFLTEIPRSSLTPENAYHTPDDWQKTLNGAYAMLQKLYVGKNTIKLTEVGTDEVQAFDLSWGHLVQLDYHTFSTANVFFDDHYLFAYEGVKRCNAVIDMPTDVVEPSIREQMVLQSKFLRALYYFDLVRMYGGVPLWTQSHIDRAQIMKPRSSVDEVYEVIVRDLKDAENGLPTQWSKAEDKGRATAYAAQAMLARVYIQWSKPREALEYCQKLDGKFHLYSTYREIFDPKNKNAEYENIFEVQFRHSGSFGLEGSLQHSMWGPRGVGGPEKFGGWGGFGPTQYVYDSFDDMDKRREAFFWTEFNGVRQSPPSQRKFFDNNYGNVIEDDELNFIVIRYADILLMKAEALNTIGDSGNGKYDAVNAVRSRAGLPLITVNDNLTKEQFADRILEERLHELCFEHLRRWDLIRFGKLSEYLKDRRGIVIQPHHVLYPIPQRALDANEAISENNPGY